MNSTAIRELGFELGYLAMLTEAGVKPLSRWENEFDARKELCLAELGLRTRSISRVVQSGRRVRELIFSRSDECLEAYTARFDGRPIDKDRDTIRLEGRLFGYPSCCVESFVSRGYARNSLRWADQRILFHWACPNCAMTPLLLPQYRRIYRECRRLVRGGTFAMALRLPNDWLARWLRQAAATAATAASLAALGLSSPAVLAQAGSGDPHRTALPLAEDPDQDYLNSDEETILGMNPADADEDRNGVADGVDLALLLSAAIDRLPDKPSTTEPYVVHHLAFGLETCAVCGEQVNMGQMEIINPLENLRVPVPYLAKHYLEHGGLAFDGTVHSGRLQVALLRMALLSTGRGHFIAEPAGTDGDDDGLRDPEETAFSSDPANPDTDADGIVDGIDAARELRAQLESLPRYGRPEDGPKDHPFVVEHPMDGFEICPRCGERVVMDIWDVINPRTGGFISISSMALHYLNHGGFTWAGGQLHGGAGRVDPQQLQAVLTGQGDGHQLKVAPDLDGDLLTDDEEHDLGSDPANPDENANQVADGVDLARELAGLIAQLPTKPVPDQVYRLDFELRGLERCDICATNVNMGHLTVCNPTAQLYVQVPYIALHYLEHGGFSFAGDVHGARRLDVMLLKKALQPSAASHQLPVAGDSDNDGLTDPEEGHFHLDAQAADTNGDGVPDGFELANGMWREISDLSRATNDPIHAVEHRLRGLVTCPVCGAEENMGYLEIVNLRENLSMEVPYLALHFMRHGSFAYAGDAAPQRIDPCQLDLALHGHGSSHLVQVPGDADADGLLDGEEAALGTRPDAADSNGDGIPDGVALARKFHQRIAKLPAQPTSGQPYVVHHPAKCTAPCPCCGVEINCGSADLVNPWAGLSTNVSYLNLHFIERGSFAVSEQERADPLLLEAILRPSVLIAAQSAEATLRWKGKPDRKYQVLTAPAISGPWTGGPILTGDGAELIYRDPVSAGQPAKFFRVLAWDEL